MDIANILRQAYELAAQHSSDPLTKNGAILYNQANCIIGTGANQLPNGVKHVPTRLDRPQKYNYIIHAEQNAIADAACKGHSTKNSTLYCPWAACTSCAKLIIQAGISKIITHQALMQKDHARWDQEISLSMTMLHEAGIELIQYNGSIGGVQHIFDGQLWHP